MRINQVRFNDSASSKQRRPTLNPSAIQQRQRLKSIVGVSNKPNVSEKALNYDEDGNVMRDTIFYAQTPNALSMSTMGQLNDNLKNLIKKRGEDEDDV